MAFDPEQIKLGWQPTPQPPQSMTPNEYIDLVLRSEATIPLGDIDARLLHAMCGINTESGELTDQIKKVLFYARKIDVTNIKEELGDLSWYISLALSAIGSSWEEIWTMNIAKLRKRYPEKFTAEQAKNRDSSAERMALEENEQKS